METLKKSRAKRGPRRDLKPRVLPNRIRQERLRLGLTLQQVADYLGDITPQAVHQAELYGTLKRQYWYRLEDLFGIDARDLERPPETQQITS